eukprot:PhM_4_TR18218/c0_g1_i1/m.16662
MPELLNVERNGRMAICFNCVDVFDAFIRGANRSYLLEAGIPAAARACNRTAFLAKMCIPSPFDFPETEHDTSVTLKTAILTTVVQHVQQLVRDDNFAEASELFRRVPLSLQRVALDRVLPPQAADVLYVLCGISNVVDPLRLVRSIRCMEYAATTRIHDLAFINSSRRELIEPFLTGVYTDRPQLVFKHPGWQEPKSGTVVPLPTCIVPVDDFECRYLRMFVPLEQRPAAGTPLTVTRREFLLNLEAFTGVPDLCGLLLKHTMAVAGGAVVACLSAPLAADATLSERCDYFARECADIDVDVFPIASPDTSSGLTAEDEKIIFATRRRLLPAQCANAARVKSLVEAMTACDKDRGALVLATSAVITIVRPYPHRRVRLHNSVWR